MSPLSAGRSARRPAIDVARVLALLVVVLGHLAMAVVDRPDGDVRGDNLFELEPAWAWLAALAPMPVFFAAGGWANATSTLRSSAARLASLAGTAAVVVTVWSVAVTAAVLINGSAGLVGRGARLATQPLWFLAAYIPLAAAGGSIAGLVRRRGGLCIGGALGLLAVIDIVRFGAGAPELIGWLGFPLAWATPWLLGAWWRDRAERGGFRERRTGSALLVAGVVGGWGLVAFAGYSAPLIDVSQSARSNTTPPGLYTAAIGVAQAGACIAFARELDRIGQRWERLWRRFREAAVGVYMWHLTALSLCVGLIAIGLPSPERLTGLWWATRPVWWASVLVVTGALTFATGASRARLRRGGRVPGSRARLIGGAVTATAGATIVGLEGPRSIGWALVCTASFGGGWWLLRGPSLRGPSHTRPTAGDAPGAPTS